MINPEILSESVTLYEGDCLDVLPTLTGVDAVVTDPPYGISWKRGVHAARNSKPHKGIENDQDTSVRDKALSFLGKIPGIVFGSFYAQYPMNVKQVLVWHKPPDSGLVGSVTGFRRDAEPIFLTGNWPVKHCQFSSVLRSYRGQSATTTETGHPHTKPLDLIRDLIRKIEADTIIDPFAGSGTTGVAAILEGRKAILVEKDPKYCDIIRRRIAEAEATGPGSLFKYVSKSSLFESVSTE